RHTRFSRDWSSDVCSSDLDKILKVVEYCVNDVEALEGVFNHTHSDFIAREILADLSGLTVNHSTRQHSIKIMFGNERNPQQSFRSEERRVGKECRARG